MAAYNAAAYVAEAIESVLRQSRPPDEFIIVDDGSTDGTWRVLERYREWTVCLSQNNCGPTVAVNRAITLASGDALAFQDSDDIWCEHKLERQLAVLESCSEIEAVFGMVRQFVSPDIPVELRNAFAPANEIIHGETKLAMLIRRAAFDRIGGFHVTIRNASMVEWLGRAKLKGLRSRTLEDIVALRRLHLTNGGRINAASQDDETLVALKRVIEARRALL
jgi:glycosyltransferase involved in cell wall biosynthesis